MVGVELLRELVETVILTGKVSGSDPTSLLIIAEPESGKTSVVLERPCKAVEVFTDITGRGLHYVLLQNHDMSHIVINDMVAVLSHKQSVNKYTISQLNAVTEEGICKIASPGGIQEFKCGRKGIIASLTIDLVKDGRCWWNKVGFSSRMLPFCYSYPEALTIKIKAVIDDETAGLLPPTRQAKEFTVPAHSVNVTYEQKYIKEIRYIADIRSQLMNEQGFRRLKQYHALAQAHAILRNGFRKAIVGDQEVEFMRHVDLFVSYTTPRPLTKELLP